MKAKNIFSVFVLLAVAALSFTSCHKDDDEVFGESSSARLQAAMQQAKAVLRGAENGWVMDYYIGDNSTGGGYAFIVKFDSLTCTVMSEAAEGDDTSYYKMTTDNGPVLTFDTYNRVFHEFATPGPSEDEYEGRHADFEFLIMSATPELVVMKGKRTGNLCYLHPLERNAEDYLADVKDMRDSLIVSTGTGKMGDMTIDATFDLENRQAEFVNPADTSMNMSCAFTYTDTGIRLSETVDFTPKPVSGFSYDNATYKLTCTDEGNSGFVMQGYTPSNWRAYDSFEGTYDLAFGINANSISTLRVELVSNNDGSTYRMTGLNSNYDIECTYNRARGALEIRPQTLGEASGVEVHLCILDDESSFVTWAPAAGIVFSWNEDEEHPVFNAGSNDYEDFYSAGLTLWAFRDGSAMTSEAANKWLESHTSWWFDGSVVALDMVRSLTKVD